MGTKIPKIDNDVAIPLSRSQQRLWFLQQLNPSNPFYNYSEYHRLKGKLDVPTLEQSLNTIIAAHDILRTIYPVEGNGPEIKVTERSVVSIHQIDFSHLPINESELKAKNVIYQESNKPFDLAKGPLYRFTLFKLAPELHIFLIGLHHIIIDEWSMQIFRNQLARHYAGTILNKNPSIESPEIQFVDYAHWENHNKIDEKQLDYWKNKLSGNIEALNIPTDFPRPLQPSYHGKRNVKVLSKELSKAVLEISQEKKVTPFVLLLAAYFVMLYRYTGQKDILIGTPISKRNHKSLEGLIGFFVDTIVLRSEINGSSSFSGLVDEIRSTTLDGFSNKDIPFDLLVKSLKPERLLSINPFFQVMFLYNSLGTPETYGDGLDYDYTVVGAQASKFDLTLFVTEENDILTIDFEYATDLFKEITIERFQTYYTTLLEGIVSNRNTRVDDMPMIPVEEKDILLEQVRDLGTEFDGFDGIHAIIENVALENPDKPAVSFGGRSISYGKLNEEANAVATRILGIASENRVIGLCLERSIDMIIGLLGILKSGKAYLPIDPEYPSQRIDFILKDADVDVLITQKSLLANFVASNLKPICLDDGTPIEVFSELPKVQKDDIAYLIYTSGSTGEPKGVPITHGNIISSSQGRLDFYDENPSAFLLMSSISFDSSKAGIFWTLCTGGNLVIAEKRIEQDVKRILEAIQEHNISHTLMLPSLYKLVLEDLENEQIDSLSTVIVAGEECSKSLCKSHFNRTPKISLYNEYGPTEATVWCIAHKIEKEDVKNGIIPIGKAVSGAQVYLFNDSHQLVPFGAIGEIYIGGPGLAGSYVNRPDLTQEAYITNPFDKNEKLYKTGDLGKYNSNGDIEFLGRADYQVKIRGYRIELNEVEKAIKANHAIENAVVLVEDLNELDIDFGSPEKIPNTEDFISALKHLSQNDLDNLFESIRVMGDNERSFMLNNIENKIL